jgi:hypothetical protein
MRTTYAVSGHAAGHLTFDVPGANSLIDTYLVVRNEEEAEQGSFNSTLKWSTASDWTNTGEIFLISELRALAVSSGEFKSWKIRETLNYGDNRYRASTYLFQEYSETLDAFGEGQYHITNGYDW